MVALNSTESENPYVGPRTFMPEERAKFFGRAREARELTALIISNRLVLFYAASGAGKSSLLNTMIGPMLVEEGFELLPTGRVSGYSGEQATADNIYLYNLFLSLHQAEEVPADLGTLDLAQFLDNLVCHEDGTYYYDPTYQYPDGTQFKPRVLIIDQFEELVTTNVALWKQRGGFFEQLAQVMAQDEKLWVVLTMREDFVARFDPYLHLTPNQLRHRYYMERLARPAAMEAMQMPVREIRPFDPPAIEQLADNLLRIRTADGQEEQDLAQFVEPVQLQAVCYQMWEELRHHPGTSITVEDVVRFANVEKALTNFYEEMVSQTVRETAVSEVDLRNWFEQELITEAGTRNMVYRGEEVSGSLPTPVADYVRHQFILSEVVRPGGTWYELVHDRFVSPIVAANGLWRQNQPLLRLAMEWDQTGRPVERLLNSQQLAQVEETNWQALGPLVAEYLAAGRDIQRQEAQVAQAEKEKALRQEIANANRLRRLTRWLSVAVGVAVIATIVALVFLGIAQQESKEAVAARSTSDINAALAVTREAEAVNAQATAQVGEAEVRQAIQASQMAFAAQLEQLLNDPEQSLLLAVTGLHIKIQPDTHRQLAENLQTPYRTTLHGHGERVWSAVFSPDGQTIVTASADGTVRLWDEVGNELAVLRGHEGEVISAVFSPDGQWIVTASRDGTARLWDGSGNELAVLRGHEGGVYSAVFSPDGQMIVTASNDGTARLWDGAGNELAVLRGHEREVWSAVFSPDGQAIVTANADGTARLWNLAGNELAVLRGHESAVISAVFSPDGQ